MQDIVRSLQVKFYLPVPKHNSVLLCSPFLALKMKDGIKKKAKVCLCATLNLDQRCSPLAQRAISLSWTSLLTEMAEGHVWYILLLVQPSLLNPRLEAAYMPDLWGQDSEGGAAQRRCLRPHHRGQYLVQLHWRGQLTNCAIASVTLTCPQNFHYWAHALQCRAKFVEKIFLALKNMFQSCWFPFAALRKKACPGSIYFQVKRQLS